MLTSLPLIFHTSQYNEEDVCVRRFHDHHHTHWGADTPARGAADAREIPVCLQRLLQGVHSERET